MNVVIRGLMAAGMSIYAAMHISQSVSPPPGAPGWLAGAFAVTALAALVVAAMLILTPVRGEARWEGAAALLAGLSAIALLASYTVGFFGVAESDLRAETAIVAVAELVTLAAYAIGWLVSDASSEQLLEDEGVGARPTVAPAP
jgi:hypothetical protein